ncbi:hypothetical protein RJ639_017823, partial [Escallonia herrerae]
VLLMALAGCCNHSIIQNSFSNSLSCLFGFESLSLDLAPEGVSCVFIKWLQHADVKDRMELAAPPMRRINFLLNHNFVAHVKLLRSPVLVTCFFILLAAFSSSALLLRASTTLLVEPTLYSSMKLNSAKSSCHLAYFEGGDRKARKFETGLNPDIQEAIAPLNISDYHEIVDRALNIERTLGFTRAKRAQMSLSRPPVPQWQAGRFPSTSGGGKFFRTDMRSIAYTPRPQTQGFMPRPFITGQRPQPRPGVRPTQYMPPQQQPVQAVSRYCTFCGMTGHTEEVCRKRKGTCFACGAQGHQMRDCPKKKGFVATTGDISGTGIGTGRRVNKPTIKARAFALGQDEVQGSPAVVGGLALNPTQLFYLVEEFDAQLLLLPQLWFGI